MPGGASVVAVAAVVVSVAMAVATVLAVVCSPADARGLGAEARLWAVEGEGGVV